MLASDIIDRVRLILNDANGTRWTNAEVFKWIDDAQLLIALVRPDEVNSTANLALVPGSKQSVPQDGLKLLDIKRNLKDSQGTPGRAIRLIDRNELDLFNPDWHSATQATEIKHYLYDERESLAFWVYPPAKTGARVELMYSRKPTPVTDPADVLVVRDIYKDAVVNYVLFRAYAKDADYANNSQLMTGYLQIVNSLLGMKLSKDVAFSPKLYNKGVAPNAAAAVGGV